MPKKITPDSRCGICGEPSAFLKKHMTRCVKHFRFGRMQEGASRAGKEVPSFNQLEAMLSPAMKCPDCERTMCWRSSESRSLVACLQHYRDGKMAIVCLGCNTAHGGMPDDFYRDSDGTTKYCHKCSAYKLISEFNSPECKACRSAWVKAHIDPDKRREKAKQWREANRETYNARMRTYKARRKAEKAMKKAQETTC